MDSKMKIFERAKTNLHLLYLDANTRPFHRMQLLYAVECFTAIVLQCLYLVNDANTVRDYMQSMLITVSGILVYLAYMSAIFETTTIYEFIDYYETIINDRLKYPRSKAIYEKTNQLTEKLCKVAYISCVYIGVPCLMLPKAIYCFFVYFSTDLGSNAFELPIPTWFPFDWKNPMGYSLAILLQIRIIAMAIRFIACFASFGCGCFLFSTSLAKDLENDIHSINKNTQHKRTREHIREQLIDFIRFTNLKRLLAYFTDIYRIIIIMLFVGCMCTILLALLLIQIDVAKAGNEIDSLILLVSVVIGVFALFLNLLACEIGQRCCDTFDGVDNALGQMNFYLLPMDVQRLLLMVIMYAQKPLVVQFFGSLCLTRDQFKKVIKFIYQNFMILREFYK